uniref:Uncharacterized protein MANES_05G018300 n=1 Tax=Rhizophora mucronata TaxID=61149 RepID=A0A2P2KDN6_RHIMU
MRFVPNLHRPADIHGRNGLLLHTASDQRLPQRRHQNIENSGLITATVIVFASIAAAATAAPSSASKSRRWANKRRGYRVSPSVIVVIFVIAILFLFFLLVVFVFNKGNSGTSVEEWTRRSDGVQLGDAYESA